MSASCTTIAGLSSSGSCYLPICHLARRLFTYLDRCASCRPTSTYPPIQPCSSDTSTLLPCGAQFLLCQEANTHTQIHKHKFEIQKYAPYTIYSVTVCIVQVLIMLTKVANNHSTGTCCLSYNSIEHNVLW